MEPDYYSVLGVSRDSSYSRIKQAFRKLSRAIHPDKQPSSLQTPSKELFIRVQKSKSILLNPVSRYIYDNFGNEGLTFLNSSAYRDLSEFTPEEREGVEEKIKKYLKETKEKEMRAQTYPRTSVNIRADLSSFIDTNPSFPSLTNANYSGHSASSSASPPNFSSLSNFSFNFQQSIRLNLSSRLAADLGFLVYTQNKKAIVNMTPRVNFDLYKDYKGSLSLHLGDRWSGCLGVSKSWENLSVEGAVCHNKGGVSGVVYSHYSFSKDTYGRINVLLGDSSLCVLKVGKLMGSYKAVGSFNSLNSELQCKLTKEIDRHFLVRTGFGFNKEGPKSTLSTSIKVLPKTFVKFNLETQNNEVVFSTKIRRGSINMKIPLTLSFCMSRKSIALGLAMLTIGVYISKRAYQSLKKLSHGKKKERKQGDTSSDMETNPEENKEEEEKKQYEREIKEKAAIIAQSEREKQGLIILEAYSCEGETNRDLTLCLQSQVANSSLFQRIGSKTFVKYEFGGIVHQSYFRNIISIPF